MKQQTVRHETTNRNDPKHPENPCGTGLLTVLTLPPKYIKYSSTLMYGLACSLVFTSEAHNRGGEKRSGNTHRKNVTAIVEPGAADQTAPATWIL